ncbi:hypothetical protein LTR56_002373 [Elasticomyces elasticus]|nr:hypothetical protein LTR56_002373 [Elasticomyces elasticus]KAK3665937.1 hypothetical protein LTR22_003256 [Elasticomyces elasticus]KAK4929409.1 hypothetical protein LTR49_004013 [Elasticomyces elasticus]KAK5764698.1 hypothetical protein LTS12_005199 [Elasticomyces elasticus]
MAAAAAVADTAELTEMILLQLPLLDILMAQRVNRTWQQLITTSPDLQRALFFRAVDGNMLVEHPGTALSHATGGKADVLSPVPHGCREVTISDASVIMNPFLSCSIPLKGNHVPECWKTIDQRGLRGNASWRRMLLSQPPLVRVVYEDDRARHSYCWPAQDREEPLRLQDMQEAAALFHGGARLLKYRPHSGTKEYRYIVDMHQRVTGVDVLKVGKPRTAEEA